MSNDSITRVNYFDRQFLRTQDFTDEQAYHVAMRRRHNIAHHTWGIVSGLELVLEEGNFYVQPGMAVDGYGRELFLAQKQTLASSAFVDKGSKELDVWLSYGLKSSDKPPAGYAGCGNGDGDVASFYRWQETAQVLLEKPDPDFLDRRRPEGVALQDLSFNPSRTPPDSPQSFWPIFLGQIINDPANQQQPYAVKLNNRPYVGLVGEAVIAPSGRALVQVGAERSDDTLRFAVFTRDESTPQVGGNAPALQTRLEIDDQGEVNVRGDTSLYGNLTMAGGAIEFEAGTARDPALPPWNIYHLAGDENNGVEELRVEMAGPQAGGVGGNNRVVIGAWFKGPDETGQEKEMFHPCLTISDDCTVTVHGNLVVRGTLTSGSRAEGNLTPAAQSFSTGAFLSGVFGTGTRSSGAPIVELSRPDFVVRRTEGEPSVEEFADRLAANPSRLAAFAERMKASHPELLEALRAALTTGKP